MGNFLVGPLQCRDIIYPPGWNSVKVSENLGAVAPAVTSLEYVYYFLKHFWSI
jgi:hypothetical protein